MASNIDPTKPVQGQATTESIRLNFAAAKTEIEALQGGIGQAAADAAAALAAAEAAEITAGNAQATANAAEPAATAVHGLDDLTDVLIATPANRDALLFDAAAALWKNTPDIGYIGIPQNPQSANYTLALTDVGKHLLHPSADATARTFTIPANAAVAFPVNSAVSFVNQNGGGIVTIAITSDTMRLAGVGTTGSRSLAANGVATALKITSTEWIISGVGLT